MFQITGATPPLALHHRNIKADCHHIQMLASQNMNTALPPNVFFFSVRLPGEEKRLHMDG